MACRTESKVIGEKEYSVTQWPADKAMLMKFKLTKTFGASLAKLANLGNITKKSKSSENEEMSVISDSLNSLFESSSPDEIMALIKLSIEGVAVGDPGESARRITSTSFNEVFSADDLLEIYKVFLFVLQVNYGNFLKGQWAENLLVKVKESL